MPERKYPLNSDYRYGFNGKENDKEWGNQLIQDYGFRLYNPAIAKFLSVDPLAPEYPWYTPYQFAGNMPIVAIDLDGLEPWTENVLKPTNVFNHKTICTSEKIVEESKRNAANIAKAAAAVPPHLVPVNPKEKSYAYTTPTRSSYEATTSVSKNVNSVYMLGVEAMGAPAFDVRDGYNEKDAVKMLGGLAEMAQWQKGLINKAISKIGIGVLKVKPRSPCGCFTVGTIVKTSTGDKNIEDIIVGDWVWAYDDSTGITELKQVLQLHKYTRDAIYKIYVNGEIIETTSDHPFYVGGKYIEAKKLVSNHKLKLQIGAEVAIDSIVIIEGEREVYNFTVDDYHTYFVGIDGVLVHNDPCDYGLNMLKTHPISGNPSSRTVADYVKKIKNGKSIDPIKVAEITNQNGVERLYVLDGHHRVEAAIRTNTKIKYEVISPENYKNYNYDNADEILDAHNTIGRQPNKIDSKTYKKQLNKEG
jgi:RHS repeat-associated protein